MGDLTLHIGGTKYGGWKNVRISWSLEALAQSFQISGTERWTYEDDPVPIVEGDFCEVHLNGELRLTGFVDEVSAEYGPDSDGFDISGRSLTGDLVDSSAVGPPIQWIQTPVLEIARALCDPFSIDVSTETDLSPVVPKFAIQGGETVFDALSRLARIRGVFLYTTPKGDLVFRRLGSDTTRTVLRYGDNVQRARLVRNWTDRFSKYLAKGQSSGSDAHFGRNAAGAKAEILDDELFRYRPMIVNTEDEVRLSDLERRATWERNVRVGRSKTYSCSVEGWEHDSGLWEPGLLVPVDDPRLRIRDTLVLSSVNLTRNDSGSIAELELTLPEAFDIQPIPKKRRSSSPKSLKI